jgi:hypothetical protein
MTDDSLDKSSAKHQTLFQYEALDWRLISLSCLAPYFVVMWAMLSKRPFLSCCAHQLHMAMTLKDLDGSLCFAHIKTPFE